MSNRPQMSKVKEVKQESQGQMGIKWRPRTVKELASNGDELLTMLKSAKIPQEFPIFSRNRQLLSCKTIAGHLVA